MSGPTPSEQRARAMLGIVWVPGYFAVIPLTADVIALRDYEAEGDPDLHSTDIEWYDEVGWHVLVNVPETGIPTYSWRHDPSGREQCGELAPPPPVAGGEGTHG